MPFKAEVFQAVFSYSVNFDEVDRDKMLAEIARVIAIGGVAKIQMAHRYGFRSTYQRYRLRYANSGQFRVRYWPWRNLRAAFERAIGPTAIFAEAFGGLGLLYCDRKI